jgi:hypothetical protein
MTIRTGDRVAWPWGQGEGEGKVAERHTETVSRRINGSEITRHGRDDNAALVIEQQDGQRVLKLESEVRQA